MKALKNTLFNQRPKEIEKWVEDVEGLGIEQINSFVNGLRRDLPTVKKVIELDYSNGLAEGSANRLKVTKRIMYSHNSLKQPKGKLLFPELKRKIN